MVALILNVPDLFLLTYYFLEFLMPFSLLSLVLLLFYFSRTLFPSLHTLFINH